MTHLPDEFWFVLSLVWLAALVVAIPLVLGIW
jgi:hypothetical protein